MNPPLQPGDPATTIDATLPFGYNGAVGQSPDIANVVTIYDIAESGTQVVVQLNAPSGLKVGNSVRISGTANSATDLQYDGIYTVTGIGFPSPAPSGGAPRR